MTLCLYKICCVQWFVFKIITAQMQQSVPKYMQMGNMGPIRPGVPNMPSVPYPNPTLSSVLNSCHSFNLPNLANLPNFSSLPNFSNLPNLPNFSHLPNFSNLPLPPSVGSPMAPMPVSMNALAPIPMPNLPLKMACQKSSSFDPTVLNNLAIALQLLILTNLLNPPDLTDPKTLPTYSEPKPTLPASESPPYPPQNTPQVPQASPQTQPAYSQPPPSQQGYYQPEDPNFPQNGPFSPPNSKFLGTSGFADTSMPASVMGPPFIPPNQTPNPRNGYSLMSPYEALTPAPNQCYSKDVFAQYGPQNFKADFQSPYQSIMVNDNTSKDLFSLF